MRTDGLRSFDLLEKPTNLCGLNRGHDKTLFGRLLIIIINGACQAWAYMYINKILVKLYPIFDANIGYYFHDPKTAGCLQTVNIVNKTFSSNPCKHRIVLFFGSVFSRQPEHLSCSEGLRFEGQRFEFSSSETQPACSLQSRIAPCSCCLGCYKSIC